MTYDEMDKLSSILRGVEGKYVYFYCPGCECTHQVALTTSGGAHWEYNQNPEKPTFSPSLLVTSGHYVARSKHHNDPANCEVCKYNRERPPEETHGGYKCGICHSFIRDGRIEFLSDCTHALAGQTVDIPVFPNL